jgi:hypothetical protein
MNFLDAELHLLKRAYLKVLPHPQIIELCMNFEMHVPEAIRNALWPQDLESAIAEQQAHSLPPAQILYPKNVTGNESLVQPSTVDSITNTGGYALDPSLASTTFPSAESSYQYPGSSFTPTPYVPVAGPSQIHPGYQNPIAGVTLQDLPSYEVMIIEAITQMNEPDGSAPKDVFTWMDKNYVLQANFRPSASQALQKAFRKGRFEKGTNGKYRLNPTWEGGPVSISFAGLGGKAQFDVGNWSPRSQETTRLPGPPMGNADDFLQSSTTKRPI